MTSTTSNRRIWRFIGIGAAVLLAVVLIGALGFVIWASNPAQPMPEALAALESSAQVTVETEPWLTFTPATESPLGGFIFYPGGLVDARAYAPAAHAIAAAGYQVVIVPMPLNLAVFAPNRAEQVMAAYPAIEPWSIGGHSLGGAMAASYVYQHPEQMKNLILWAAYPPGNSGLNESEIAVSSIFGTLDGVATPEEIEASRASLPAGTEFVAIEGGNHAQFGWYGDQDGDNPATISREEQQRQTIEATLRQLNF